MRRRARLASGLVAAGERSRDLIEGHGEHVMQHECDPLGGSQRFEYHEKRETDRVGQYRLVLGIGHFVSARDLVRGDRAQGFIAPRFAGAQHVKAPRHDRRQPST
jgi:hypothetical protein